jgi:hypothetical protein
MYPAKQQITDAIGSGKGDLFRSLLEHPGFALLEQACYTQLAISSPGQFGSEIISQQYFFGSGMKGVFDMAKELANEDVGPLSGLEEEEDPELQAQLLE